MEPATDLDILIRKGFDESEARQALHQTRGNLEASILYLTRGQGTSGGWNRETGNEWLDNVNSSELLTETSRAIRKSMYYLSVPRWDRKDGHVVYTINIILRDGRAWKLQKRYSLIHEFWRSLPLGSTKHFTHTFPQPVLWHNEEEEFIEQRRRQLDEWFGELSMDEKSMSDSRLIALLDRFIETSAQPPPAVSFNTNSDLPNWVVIPQSNLTNYPLNLETFSSKLPCKLNLGELFPQRVVSKTEAAVSLSITGSDVTTKQISKDLSRDRIIVQGKRYEGSESGLQGILEATYSAAEHIIRQGGGTIIDTDTQTIPPSSFSGNSLVFSKEIIQELCLTSLGQLGRTESAYASLSALTTVIDQGATPELILVPESVLAHPLLMRFRLIKPDAQPLVKSQHVGPSPLLGNTTIKDRTPVKAIGSDHHPQTHQQQKQHVSPLTHNIQKRSSPLMPPQPPGSSSAPSQSRRQSPNSIPRTPEHHQSPASSDSSPNPNSPPPFKQGIICDMQATTVYRFSHFETMHTVLQIRATFCQSIKLHCESQGSIPRMTRPEPANANPEEVEEGSAPGDGSKMDVTLRENRRKQIQQLFLLSKSFVIFDRDTRTSNRDWK